MRISSVIIANLVDDNHTKWGIPSANFQLKGRMNWLRFRHFQVIKASLNDKSISDLGGLDNFKDWLKLRAKAFSQEAIQYGLPYPKGLLSFKVQANQ